MYRKIWKDTNQEKVFTFEEWTGFQIVIKGILVFIV